jgi:membrane protease YdiL (CAAX protease family)
MNNRRQLHAVVCFIVVTFGGVWALWSVPFILGTPLKATIGALLVVVGMWGPGVAALAVTRFVLREPLRTTAIGRLGPLRYYAWAWLIPVLGTLAALALTVLLGIARFDPGLTLVRKQLEATGMASQVPLSPGMIVLLQTIGGLTLAPFLNSVFTLGEELGWRGFLLPRLIRGGMGQWWALAASGAVWGLWHAPLVLRGLNYPDHPRLGVLLMIVFCILLGILFGWLRLASRSVWPPTIAHATLNAIGGLPVVVLTPFNFALGGALTSVVGWLPLALLIAWLAWSGRLPATIGDDEESDETA